MTSAPSTAAPREHGQVGGARRADPGRGEVLRQPRLPQHEDPSGLVLQSGVHFTGFDGDSDNRAAAAHVAVEQVLAVRGDELGASKGAR